MQLRLRLSLELAFIYSELYILYISKKMRIRKFHLKLCHIVKNLRLTLIITLITASVCILRHFFILTMTTTLPYKSQTSKVQQEKVIQSDCKNTNRNSNHGISQYHNPIPCYNIGTSRCKKGITKA